MLQIFLSEGSKNLIRLLKILSRMTINFPLVVPETDIEILEYGSCITQLSSELGGAILDIITNFYNICSTSNLSAKFYIEYSHCYIFLSNSIYTCYVLQKSCLCFPTVWSTLRTVWYDAPRAGFSKIAPRPLLAIFCRSQKWRLYAV